MPQLLSYFENARLQRVALDATATAGWFGSKELGIYNSVGPAYDQSLGVDKAFEHFAKIDSDLTRLFTWCRPHPRSECWAPRKIYETIMQEFTEFAWRGCVSLTSFSLKEHGPRLRKALYKMRGIKPNKNYPHMPVSKFLHFFNPGLFPIYDTEMIENRVFKRFKPDFRRYAEDAGIPFSEAYGETEAFLSCYVGWASSLISASHPSFMPEFAKWLERRAPADLKNLSVDPLKLYARAFEYTALGAAEGELAGY